MAKKISKEVIMVSLVVAILLLISSMSISSTATTDETTTLLMEVENEKQLQHIEENEELLVNYNNGKVLVELPKNKAEEYKNAYDTEGNEARYNIKLGMSGHSFDRRDGLPSISSDLKFDDMQGYKPYIIQFAGPIASNEWKQRVDSKGAEIESEVGNYALIARMDRGTYRDVNSMDIVTWTAPYHPAFKLSKSLESKDGMVDIHVDGWTGVDHSVIANKLDEIGATVGRTNDFGVIASVDSDLIPTIANINEVYSIDSYQMPETKDTVANDIHEATSLWYTSWSGLSSRITGAGEVVGIQDSGFLQGDDTDGMPDFFDGPNGDRVIRYTDQTGDSDPDGNQDGVSHGTHCAGIVLENGWCWDTHNGESTSDRIWHNNEATGIAPEAELSIDGVVAQGGGINSDPSYWDTQESDGARVFSNSWGEGSGDYGTTTEGIDDRQDPYSNDAMTNAGENIILFAAGNDGPGEDTISPRPQTKNGLGIGASQNYRTEWHSAENPNKVADFSSRGGTYSEGRIKPDLTAVGTAVVSALGPGEWDYWAENGAVPQPDYIQEVDEYDYNTKDPGSDGRGEYRYMQGTSMACPMAAGATLLTREYYKDIEGMTAPSNPLVKATMINGADRMSETLYDYPDHSQGWGRINMKNSLYPDSPTSVQYDENTFTGTGTWNPNIDLGVNSGDVPLKASLVWIDSSGISLNRQLDFEMTDPSGDTYYSGVNNYDSTGWTQPNTDNGDTVNNVHRVEVENPESGEWSMTVNANSIPSDADCALVISGDFGPQDSYNVDLQTDYPTTHSVVAGGQTQTQISVRNWGTTQDTINLDDDSDTSLSLSYSPSSSLTLDSEEKQVVDVEISADAGITPDVYDFSITGTSSGDSSVEDNLRYQVEVLSEKLPHKEVATNSTVDESYADVLTFTDTGGTDWIFLAYKKDTDDGQQVFVKHSELDSNGRPIGWSTPVNVQGPSTNPTESPAWIQLLHIPSGDYEDRVMCYWNGGVPGSDPYEAESKTTWTDSGNYGSWATPVQMDQNYGTDETNNKRSSYMLWRDDGTSDGELMYVFEHLDSSVDGGQSDIGIAYHETEDGGSTWDTPSDFPNLDTSNYYYFFPDGVTDQNNVNWHFFYYRETTGNSRKIVALLQDDSWGTSEIDVMGDLQDEDNHQFPRASHLTNSDGTNEIHVSSLYDHGGTNMDMSTAYATGDYTSGSTPTFTSQDSVAGSTISDSGYIDSNVLASTTTEQDDYAWHGYQESDTVFDYINLDAARTQDLYNTVEGDKVTRDNYAKLNPEMDSLTIGTTSYTYMSYHSSQGTATDVDYNIYLAIFHSDWESEADTEGPEAKNVASQPDSVTAGESIDLSGTIDDTSTGFSTISDAEWIRTTTSVTDPTSIDWSGASTMGLSGSSEIETASAPNIDTTGWSEGTHRLWVRGQDSAGNWGTANAGYVDLDVAAPETSPSVTISSPSGGAVWEAETTRTIWWNTTDDVDTSFDGSIEYSTDGGTSWSTITTYSGWSNPNSYDWTVPNEPSSNAMIRVTATDSNSESGSDTSSFVINTPPGAPSGLTVERWGQSSVEDNADAFTLTDGESETNDYTATHNSDDTYHSYSEVADGGSGKQILDVTYDIPVTGDSAPFTLYVEGYESDSDASDTFTVSYTVNGADGETDVITLPATEGTESYELTGVANGDTVNVQITDTWADRNEAKDTVYIDHLYIESGGGSSTEDNYVNWTASADDGAGDNDVAEYNIYRADSDAGLDTASVYTTVTADSSADYVYVDSGAGEGDGTDWWYRVNAVDSDGLESTFTADVPEVEPTSYDVHNIGTLTAGGDSDGWNFVSFNLEADGDNYASANDLVEILEDTEYGISGNYSKAMYYDVTNDEWRSYMPDRADDYNDLETWDNTMGVWIRMTTDDDLSVEGTAPTSTEIQLEEGWNMVSYPSSTATASDTELPAEVSNIGYFDGSAEYNLAYTEPTSTFDLEPGDGYWLYCDAPTTWTVDY